MDIPFLYRSWEGKVNGQLKLFAQNTEEKRSGIRYQTTRKTEMTQRPQTQVWANSRGFYLLKVMFALAMLSMLALFDAQKHKDNSVALKRRLASKAMLDFKSSLSNWLQHDDSIALSFGEGATATGNGRDRPESMVGRVSRCRNGRFRRSMSGVGRRHQPIRSRWMRP